MNAQTYAAAQLVRASARLLRDAMGELARAKAEPTDADYEKYNERVRQMNPAGLDQLAWELERRQRMDTVEVNGEQYRPVADREEVARLERLLEEFSSEATSYWRNIFVAHDSDGKGGSYGMYAEGDEETPFFSEAFLYNLLGKDEARTVLGIVRRLSHLAGVRFDG